MGNGTNIDSNVLVQVQNLTQVSAVAAENRAGHVLALRNDGTVRAWGYNRFAQLGDGTAINRNSPIMVAGLSQVTAIAVGNNNSYALKQDGTVWAWGGNSYGQLGSGTTFEKTKTPQQVQGNLTDITAIAADEATTLALKTDGTVMAWGYNGNGQLGNSNISSNSSLPIQVPNFGNVKAIAAGLGGFLAISDAPISSVNPAFINFADQFLFTKSAYQTITISNPGVNSLQISRVELIGANSSDFSYQTASTFPINVPSGGNATINLAFQPTVLGPRSAQLKIYSNAPNSPSTINLFGKGVNPYEIKLTPGTGTTYTSNEYVLSATVKENDVLVAGKTVSFKLLSGPNANASFTAITDGNGVAAMSYIGNIAGTDTIQATYVASDGTTQTSNTATVEWKVNHIPVPSAMGPYTVVEGSSVLLTGWAYDEDGDPLTFTWSLQYGTPFNTPGQNVTFTAKDGPYVETVIVSVCDNKGPCSASTAPVTILSAKPTATFVASAQTIGEGGSVTLSLTNPTDPSPTDRAAELTLVYDCGKGSGYASNNVCTYTDNGTYTVKGKISDKDGEFSEYSSTITVTNVKPTATFVVSNTIINQGESVTLSLTNPFDPSEADTNAGLTLAYDCGQGFGYTSLNECTFTQEGIYTVKGKITDKDGGFTEYTATIIVNNPNNPQA